MTGGTFNQCSGGHRSVTYLQPETLQHGIFFGSFFVSWQFFSPHQSLLFLHVVSSFYEDRSTVTPPCPLSRAAPGSEHSYRSEEQSRVLQKAMQEEYTKQYHIPSLTVHPPSLRTQEEALASPIAYIHTMERLCFPLCVLYSYCLWLAMLQYNNKDLMERKD